jgi:hypothetical protein
MEGLHWWQMIVSSPLHRPWVGPRSDLHEMIRAMPVIEESPEHRAYRQKRRKAHSRSRRQRAINRRRS